MERARRTVWYLRPPMSGLILFTMLAVACGTSALFYSRNRANAIEHIRTHSGEIVFDTLPIQLPKWMEERWPEWAKPVELIAINNAGRDEIAAIGRLREVRSLSMPAARIGSDDLRLLADLTKLQTLNLDASTTSDHALEYLKRMPLQRLSLSETGVSDTGLDVLSGLPLEALWLNKCRITDAGVMRLRGLNLRALSLCDTGVTDACLPLLLTLPLKYLELEGTEVTDAAVADLTALPLVSFNLSHTRVTSRGLDDLSRMRTLTHVWLSSPSVTRRRAIELAADLRLDVHVRSSTGSHFGDPGGVHLDVLDYDFRGP